MVGWIIEFWNGEKLLLRNGKLGVQVVGWNFCSHLLWHLRQLPCRLIHHHPCTACLRQAGRIPKIPSGSQKKNSHQITACNTSTHTDLAGNETCKMIIKELEKLWCLSDRSTPLLVLVLRFFLDSCSTFALDVPGWSCKDLTIVEVTHNPITSHAILPCRSHPWLDLHNITPGGKNCARTCQVYL